MSGLITAAAVIGVGSFLSAGMSYRADKAQSQAQRAWQVYSNKMTDLSNSISQNALTQNSILAADATANQALNLRQETILSRARVEVSAAAAGVKGRSVNLTVRDVLRGSAMRESERQEAFRTEMLGIQQQRLNAAFGAASQKDYSYIPKPNAASYYLGATVQTASAFMGAKK